MMYLTGFEEGFEKAATVVQASVVLHAGKGTHLTAEAQVPMDPIVGVGTLSSCNGAAFYFHVLMSWAPTGGQQTEYNT